MYLSSVGSDAPDYYAQIMAWLQDEPGVRLAFQPGTFQIALGVRALRDLYRRANLLICNREEAVEIGGADHAKVDGLLESLHRLGPEIVVVTDGPEGAYASDGSQRYRIPAFPDPSPPVERTGAGRCVLVRPRRRAGQGTAAPPGAHLGSRERHERGAAGGLPIGTARREPAPRLPPGRPGLLCRHDLVRSFATRASAACGEAASIAP